MARFLLGWELGAGRGHLVRMAGIARRLVDQGHDVAVAVQRLGASVAFPQEVACWQAPVWPRLLSTVGGLHGPSPTTMGDILVRLGLDDERVWTSLLTGWDRILQAVRPDAVAADFAPALLCAARGRVPTVLAGQAFDGVPHHLDSFPSITSAPPVYSEQQALERINAGLARVGGASIARFPGIFGADRSVAGSFTELDPYAEWRREPLAPPSVAQPLGEAGQGDEVFVYGDTRLLHSTPLWEGLVRSGLKLRAYIGNASAPQWAELERVGFAVERAPIPFAAIAARSRLAVTHGGLGFVSSALAAGLPIVVVHYDLEKQLTGEAIARLGVGGHVGSELVQADPFATSLRDIYASEKFQRRARALAPDFRARLNPSQETLVAKALVELAG